jgi:hypothetical protein
MHILVEQLQHFRIKIGGSLAGHGRLRGKVVGS